VRVSPTRTATQSAPGSSILWIACRRPTAPISCYFIFHIYIAIRYNMELIIWAGAIQVMRPADLVRVVLDFL
jgi:hypothetical protein